MTWKAAVLGASGYTGAETLRLLAGHPDIEVVHVTAQANAGERVSDLFPSLAAAYGDLRCAALDPADLDGLDVAFAALPHGESQRHMTELTKRVKHVVDIGADFRLPQDAYEQWYGETHQAPELIGSFAYGLPELFRLEIAEHAHAANPGCYPTAVILALAPLVASGFVEPMGIVADALSGISGSGRAAVLPSMFSEANESARAYGLLNHRHTAEMEMALGALASATAATTATAATAPQSGVQVLFTPHVVPMTRGILATCYARPSSGTNLSTEILLGRYREFYTDEPFVIVTDEPPATKAAYASNAVYLTVRFDERTNAVVAIAALDNLVKGASGQAVQNANLLLGLNETTGLTATGIMP